jgi:hypothetical protein
MIRPSCLLQLCRSPGPAVCSTAQMIRPRPTVTAVQMTRPSCMVTRVQMTGPACLLQLCMCPDPPVWYSCADDQTRAICYISANNKDELSVPVQITRPNCLVQFCKWLPYTTEQITRPGCVMQLCRWPDPAIGYSSPGQIVSNSCAIDQVQLSGTTVQMTRPGCGGGRSTDDDQAQLSGTAIQTCKSSCLAQP